MTRSNRARIHGLTIASMLFLVGGLGAMQLFSGGVPGGPPVEAAKAADGAAPASAARHNGITLSLVCLDQAVTRSGTPGSNTIVGTSGRDVIAGLGGNDVIKGMGGNDVICGGSGNDTISGGSGGDRLAGDSGRDRLYGGSGRDGLDGGRNSDRCSGGTGRDRATRCERKYGI